MNKHYYVAIMAGGIGSRFWPKSRTSMPKQFLDILNTGKSLIQWTYERFAAFIPEENIFVVTSEDYEDIVAQQLPQLNKQNIVTEPSRKNTAPCIAYISYKLLQKDPKAALIVAPSDHVILDVETFKNTCLKALNFVTQIKAFVTLGITPSYPNTGYGYIQHDTFSVAEGIYKVKTFTEKPNLELAKTFLASGDFLWNAGIFVWQVNNIIKAFEKFQPEMFDLFENEKALFNSTKEKEAINRIYPLCTNISIDFAIMEKADNVYVMPSSFGWSDLGTWNSAYENLEKDYLANAVVGNNVIIIDATKCMISATDNKLVLLQGLDDCIVVDTQDVLMICKKDKEQEIKEYVAEVKRIKGDIYL
ncbi:MAG TPA: mannose-1-phosphate guanylyltransferase [Chitinophagaceae bacterium]|nr:mannose-1-phosphate guanylyltransferase [Chitinophagaceae bacterium]MCC6635279.1 mannose-1-phosphate guanylyltransferase [Chitinophagaceae bacterium]HMZ46215.1 mannose-1-phosphate guanylyltransferase [Chitinophagaceae bacterium]HNF29442.1 mannose-1-phosphate guanylyltransferase [Chitinophagaceae bacterium]HNL82220.1 mannose-1-phosphate guanylyltransferase [Chitinophagaceae bacterium]